MPADVCIPDGFTDIAVDYFDDYSWRAFVALVWPAAPGHRGVARSPTSLSASRTACFRYLQVAVGDFPRRRLGRLRRRSIGTMRPRTTRAAWPQEFGDVTIGSASGIDDIGQAGIGVLDPPVVAQNGRYVRTLTLFNQVAFDHIVRNRFYLRSALPSVPSPRPERPVIEFPTGSIAVKTAWIDVSGLPSVAGETALHADGHGQARDRRRMREGDGRAHRPAHRAEDGEPAAMDLVVVRAEGRRSRRSGPTGQAPSCCTTAPARRCRNEIRCRSRRWRPNPFGRSTSCDPATRRS